MRLFIAVDAPVSVRQKISYVQERLVEIPGVSVTPNASLHATLKFIGETEENVTKVAAKVQEALRDFCPFKADVTGIGVFPGENHPRIVWVGCPALLSLQKALTDEDNTTPIPHITIARVRDGRGKMELLKNVAQLRGQSYGTMSIEEVKIKSSILAPNGPVHKDEATIKLDFTRP
ncbi:MAG: RNA 2',3'-cyclic phosphodiesterase [Candidatus Aenigmarchaeota archaeon]|nr:RNA 2',3'-cyclic phosphodiesterase [Candidatus Aenigmarchaeota archaeon]